MDNLTPSDLKTILHSKRANLYYLEHCRILVNGGRVEYLTEEGKRSLYWNIPIANTTFILLGTGTSVTQAAMREFAKAGVMVGFCGGDGSPLFSGNEFEVTFSWISPQSEYRPTEYLQKWVGFWFDDTKRTFAAKQFQTIRLQQIKNIWPKYALNRDAAFKIDINTLHALLDLTSAELTRCETSNQLLALEAKLTKTLYRLAASAVGYGYFRREKNGQGFDLANRFLDHGNYLAYGLAATATWVMGLPHALAVLHGKTRRGGLIFDVADLIKDAMVLPCAFIAAMAGDTAQEFRNRCIVQFNQFRAMDVMIEGLKQTCDSL
ncbi:type I-F CRISPR-associated endonuclease Cas1f [Legionella septentrionalis]|uniref:type I-F CRISPR-associated endonuclease Cas1f n=1 Tax=Legionella septentrionalis TaxID=2498109 RepID=UPI000F8F22F1|nr:type I-F CRISPR-associated endonuclease Cas1f [Legionella septentrionalis]RUQ97054.1 type I-F CRISPR-associated endonuclease Cas1 [Legionella septentrionalis]